MENIELSEYHIYDKQNSEEEFTKKKIGYFASVPRLHDVMCTTPLVTPTNDVNWTVYKADGTTQVQTSTAKTLTVEVGFKVTVNVKWKWQSRTDYLNPERTAGVCGTALPNDNVYSSIYTQSGITANKTFTQTIYRTRSAPTVSGNVLVKPTGELSNAVSCNVSFQHRKFNGINTNASQPANVTGLSDMGLSTSRAYTTGKVTTQNGQYYHYIYPKALGALTKIIQNGATPVIDAFNRTEIIITNAAGASIPCYCYTTKNSGALKGDSLKFE